MSEDVEQGDQHIIVKVDYTNKADRKTKTTTARIC